MVELKSLENINKAGAPHSRSNDEDSLGHIVDEFCSTTTIHGLGRSMTSQKVRNIIWKLITLAALCTCCYHLYSVVNSYFQYKYHLEMNYVTTAQVRFPYVSVCNSEPYSFSSKYELENNKSSRFYEYQEWMEKMNLTEYLTDATAETKMLIDSMAKSSVGTFENVGMAEVQALGHKMHDFVLNCTFKGRFCSKDDFEEFRLSQFFTCYTFTGEGALKTEVSQVGVGPLNGLSLLLYTESASVELPQLDYVPINPIGGSTGVRVIIHSPGTYPEINTRGEDVQVGTSTSIALTAERYERLGLPYSSCTQSDSMNGTDYKYSKAACTDLEKQWYMASKCGCVSSLYLIPINHNLPLCLSYNETDPKTSMQRLECFADVVQSFYDSSQTRCTMPCSELQFRQMLSQTTWPGENYLSSFYKYYVSDRLDKERLKAYKVLYERLDKADTLGKMHIMRNNFLRLNVYVQAEGIERVVQSPSYEDENLLSDIGGSLGLWIGMSVVSVAEVGELFIMLCKYLWKKMRLHGHMTKTSPQSSAIDMDAK